MKKLFYLIAATVMISLECTQTSVMHRIYDLNIPASAFQKIDLEANAGTQLIDEYPKLGEYRAFRLIPKVGESAGKPIDIVIFSGEPDEDLINEFDRIASDSTTQESPRKQSARALTEKAKKRRMNRGALHKIFRAVPEAEGRGYKLFNVRVPGQKASEAESNAALIVATPIGNLQIFEDDVIPNAITVYELNTSLSKKGMQ